MFIDSIHIERFAGLDCKDFVFGRGVNIIEGENEAGKSSIAAFICYVFYGFDAEERRRYLPLDGGGVSGSVRFTTEAGSFAAERSLFPTAEIRPSGDAMPAYQETLTVTDLSTGKPAFKGEEPGEAFFGVSKAIFRGTAFVGQMDCTAVRGIPMKEAIENILFSASEDVNTRAAAEKLQQEKDKLLTEDRKSGRIFDLERKREAAQLRLDTATETAGRLQNLRSTIAQAEKKRETARRRIEQYRQIDALCEEYEKLSRSRNVDALRAQETAALEKAEQIRRHLFRGEIVPDTEYVNKLRSLASDIRHAKKAKEDAERQMRENEFPAEDDGESAKRAVTMQRLEEWGGAEHVKEALAEHRQKRHNATMFAIISALITFFIAALAMGLLFISSDIKISFVVLAVIMASLTTLCFCVRARHTRVIDGIAEAFGCAAEEDLDGLFEESSVDVERQKMRGDTRRSLAEKLSEETEALYLATTDAASMLDQLQPADSAPISPKLLTVDQIETICSQLESAIGSIGKWNAEADKYHAICEQVASENADPEATEQRLTEIRSMLGDVDPESIDRDSVHSGIEASQKEAEALADEILQSKAHFAEWHTSYEDPAVLRSMIDEIDGELERANTRLEALALAIEKLAVAGEKLRGKIAPALSDLTGQILSSLSGGKYEKVGLEHDLSITYRTAEHTVSTTEYMSEGTKDLSYLALRFALTHTLFRQTKPPMVFDESFSGLDDARLERVLYLLYSEAQDDVQSFVFTCHKRERETAEQTGLCAVTHL